MIFHHFCFLDGIFRKKTRCYYNTFCRLPYLMNPHNLSYDTYTYFIVWGVFFALDVS